MQPSIFKLTGNGIEISGSEEFVTTQLETFKELIQTSYQAILENKSIISQNPESTEIIRKETVPALEIQPYTDFEDVTNKSLDYSNVLVILQDKIQIIADLPGDSKAKQMINCILLFLWAKLQKGEEVLTFTEVREFCQYYGVLDSANFAMYMDKNKKYFMLSGDMRNKTIRLIHPGIKEAERLITELNKS